MRRFLVVGCGGSGGATLAYMMDHLRNDLAQHGIASLPAGWEFVHVDVPVAAEDGPGGLPNVPKQGGSYLPTGIASASTYEAIDDQLVAKLRKNGTDGPEALSGWAPRSPVEVKVPVQIGAGQFRAVGRAITLNQSAGVFLGLSAAWQRLQQPEVTTDLGRVSAAYHETYATALPPLILVISSMAGGAGASMALDVCRLIERIPGTSALQTCVYMLGADVFDEIPEAMRVGVRPNALAMLGEIAAAQNGTAGAHDGALLTGLGLGSGGSAAPFARVIPIGSRIGGDGAVLGRGRMKDVYRALGRGIGALVVSGEHALNDFVSFDLGNPAPLTLEAGYTGWGVEDAGCLTMAGFGYASLSMGRDRYAEYAAQRLARSSVDRLVEGHQRPGTSASATEVIAATVDHMWPQVLGALELPATADQMAVWLDRSVLAGQALSSLRAVVDREVSSKLAPGEGIQAGQWVVALRQQLAQRRGAVTEAARQVAYRAAWDWHLGLLSRTEKVVAEAVAELGLPYAQALVVRIRSHVEKTLVPALTPLCAYASADAVALGQDTEGVLAGIKGVLANSQALVERVLAAVRNSALFVTRGTAAELASSVLSSFGPQVLDQVGNALVDSLRTLERARSEDSSGLGVANLTTDVYQAWPTEGDEPPARFSHAENEVLVTSAADFAGRFVAHVSAALPGQMAYPDARGAVVKQIITGVWETSGGERPPGGLISRVGSWVCPAFPTDPESGAARVPAATRFVLGTKTPDLVARARAFVARPEESFAIFIDVGLGPYLTEAAAPGHELADRRRDVVAKFRETLALARPLVGVDAGAVQKLHNVPLSYRYKFSAVPFMGSIDREALDLLRDPSIEPASVRNYENVLVEGSVDARQVSVFGSYQHYVPIAFQSLFHPIALQWFQTPVAGRKGFWTHRRSRPLTAALPLSVAERRAMVAGWYTAQLTGALRVPLPAGLYQPVPDEPVRLFSDEDGGWVAFQHPLLTPPGSPEFEPLGWLPAVLESIMVAYAASCEPPLLGSLRPYIALRRSWDRGAARPTLGPDLHAVHSIARWLTDGAVPVGGRSSVDSADDATPEQRAADATQWARRIGDYVDSEFLPPQLGVRVGGGAWSVLDNRKKVGEAPMVRQLAGDIEWAADELERVIGLALEVASSLNTTGARRPEGFV